MKIGFNNELGSIKVKKGLSMQTECYLLLLFPIIGFLLFTIYPILWAFSKSFYYFNLIPDETKFVGFNNFKKIFTADDFYWGTWLTTIKFALYKVPVEIPFALFLAVLLTKKRRASNFLRSVYYLPSIISVAIVGVMFSNLFNYFGFINAFLMKWGLLESNIDWFSKPSTAMFVLVAGSVWSTFGINVLYFCSALNYVPDEMYESAELDGAGKFNKFI